MSKKSLLFSIIVIAVLAIAFSATSPVSAAPAGGPVAEVYYSPGGIQFVPIIQFKYIEVVLSFPNGQIARRNFEDEPRIYLGESWGPKWTDGSYTYELRAYQEHEPQGEWRDPKFEGIYTPLPVVQSGFFEVVKGAIEPNVEEEEGQRAKSLSGAKGSGGELSGTKDVCYNDDLIVDGSLCVGFDCTCNYSFGFDTIVLKENNLRIFFDDTSVAASYPRNDWRIVINDSANGGASYFGVEDSTGGRRVFTLEAGAPSHSLYVDDGGRVGMGTSTPSVEIHTVDGDTPTLRLQQDGSSGFAPQTWDVAGNETNFFVRDVTNGSTLPFRIAPDSPSSSLTIKGGFVGVGTWSPTSRLHVTESGSAATLMVERTDTSVETIIKSTGTNGIIGTKSNHDLLFNANNAARMTLETSGGITMAVGGGTYNEATGEWVNGSSRAYKEDIKNLDAKEAMDALKALNPVTFKMKVAPSGTRQVGFIAEDVPQLVAQEDRKGLAPMDIVAVLTKVVQQHQKVVQDQQETIKRLEEKIKKLENKK